MSAAPGTSAPPLPCSTVPSIGSMASPEGRAAVEQVDLSPAGRQAVATGLCQIFPLERWHEAVLAVKDSRRIGAVKVLLVPTR